MFEKLSWQEFCTKNFMRFVCRILEQLSDPAPLLKINFQLLSTKKMGFEIEPGNSFVDNVPVTNGYLRQDDQKVLFAKVLD